MPVGGVQPIDRGSASGAVVSTLPEGLFGGLFAMVAGIANPVSARLRFVRGLLDGNQALEEDFDPLMS